MPHRTAWERSAVRALCSCVLAGLLGAPSPVFAQDPAFPTPGPAVPINTHEQFRLKRAAVYADTAALGNMRKCLGDGVAPKLSAVAAAASALLTARRAKTEAAEPTDALKAASTRVDAAKKAVVTANDQSVAADRDATAKAALRDKAYQSAVAALGKDAKARAAAAAAAIDATKAAADAQVTATEAHKSAAQAEGALKEAEAAQAAAARAPAVADEEYELKLRAFDDKVTELAEGIQPSATRFQAMLGDPDRLSACAAAEKALVASDPEGDVKRRATQAAAHGKDILRKAGTLASALGSGNGFAEHAGAPDKVIFTVMSALGADQKINGTQAVLTLNVASLFASTDAERLALSPFERNMMVRAALPLSAVTDAPVASSAATPSSGATSATRFSVTFGGSLFDESDPRSVTNESCYRAVLVWTQNPMKDAGEATSKNRADYYDICNRRVAAQTRIAWRFGVGMLKVDGQSTKPEVLAGALVWAPSQYLYLDAIYQGILLPTRADAFGGALSLAGNLGGSASGVDSWGRFGVDVVGLASYAHDTKAVETEWRFTPTFRAKILNNAFAALGVGPRLLSTSGGQSDLLATFAVTYDTDQLMDQLLATPAAGAGAVK